MIANSVTSNGIVGYYDNEYRINAPAVTVTGRGDVGHATARYTNFTPVIRLLAITSVLFNVKFLESAINEISLFSESTGVPQLTAPQLGNYKIKFASLNEQIKIGDLLTSIDSLIASNQRKVDQLKEVKKLLMQKIFGQEWRFKGFTDPWEQRKLGYISDVTKLAGFEFTKYVNYSESGNIIALRGLNVKNNQLILNDVKYIDDSDFTKLSRSKLYKNDILFTYVGTVGEVAVVPDNDRFYLAPNVARIRLKQNDDTNFIVHSINRVEFFKRIIFPLIATSSQPALSMENIRKFSIMLPIKVEQTKIGFLLNKLDQLIASNQRNQKSMGEGLVNTS